MNVDVSPNNISCFLICLLAAKFDFINQCVLFLTSSLLSMVSRLFSVRKNFHWKKDIFFKTDVFTEIYFKCDYQ